MAGPRKDIEIVYEDDELVGVVKPAGLPTANAPPGVESVYTLLRSRPPGDRFVGIVSRLDAAVSGVLPVARTAAAAAALARQFRDRTVEKCYMAIVEGRFPAPLGVWADWHDMLLRRPDERKSVLVGRPGGADDDAGAEGQAKPAHVRARVLQRSGEVSLVEILPSTGRRHQLRLQFSARGCPIVGDRLYGARLPFDDGITLHAARLRFAHPRTGEAIELAAAPPAAWKRRYPGLFAAARERGD